MTLSTQLLTGLKDHSAQPLHRKGGLMVARVTPLVLTLCLQLPQTASHAESPAGTGLPDLAPVQSYATEDPNCEFLRVGLQVVNQGAAPARSFFLRFIFDGRAIGREAVPPLEVGQLD
jgi:hypothetical protein